MLIFDTKICSALNSAVRADSGNLDALLALGVIYAVFMLKADE